VNIIQTVTVAEILNPTIKGDPILIPAFGVYSFERGQNKIRGCAVDTI